MQVSRQNVAMLNQVYMAKDHELATEAKTAQQGIAITWPWVARAATHVARISALGQVSRIRGEGRSAREGGAQGKWQVLLKRTPRNLEEAWQRVGDGIQTRIRWIRMSGSEALVLHGCCEPSRYGDMRATIL